MDAELETATALARSAVVSAPYYTGPVSDHFDGQRFRNRYSPTVDRPISDILRWKSAGNGTPWPKPVRALATDVPPTRVAGLRVVLVGHASLLIQVAGCNLLVDPIWSECASPISFLGPRRHTPPGILFEDLPPIDAVLVTHRHYDHMDAPTLRRQWAVHRPRVITPLGNDVVLRGAVPGMAVEIGDWGDDFTLSSWVSAAFVPANHWSSRWLTDRRRALWCGFVLRTPAGTIYLAGDTAWGDGRLFATIRRDYGELCLAVLPIGAYEPRWFMAGQHINPAEAVQALLCCGARQGLGVHWGTFKLTDEGQDAPSIALDAALKAAGLPPSRFLAMRPADMWEPDSGPE